MWLPTLTCSQVDQHRGDAAVEVLLLRQPELGEDRVGVLLDRALGQHQRRGDRRVALALLRPVAPSINVLREKTTVVEPNITDTARFLL